MTSASAALELASEERPVAAHLSGLLPAGPPSQINPQLAATGYGTDSDLGSLTAPHLVRSRTFAFCACPSTNSRWFPPHQIEHFDCSLSKFLG